MKNDIVSKIKTTFSEGIDNEKDLVYVFSKIRKILEIEKVVPKYKFLNFYINWALHSRIDKTDLIEHFFLIESDENSEKHLSFQLHNEFFSELFKFYDKYIENKTFTPEEIEIIRELLYELFEDTPLYITERKKYIYEIKKIRNTAGEDFHYYVYKEAEE